MLTNKSLSQFLVSAVVALAGVNTAQATPLTSTFQFTGLCIDCAYRAEQVDLNSYPVRATLVLQNYTTGTEIAANNFVSFIYAGSNLLDSYSVTLTGNDNNDDTVDYTYTSDYIGTSGQLTPSLASDRIFFEFMNGQGFGSFEMYSNRVWQTCAPHGGSEGCYRSISDDYGTQGTFTGPTGDVPLPNTAYLMGLALIGMAASKRKNSGK